MRGVLINPHTRSISALEWDGKLKTIYMLLNCTSVEFVGGLPRRHGLYCDGEAKLRENEDAANTWFKGGTYSIEGNLLITGPAGPQGEETDCTLTLKEVKSLIDKFTVGFEKPPEPEIYGFSTVEEVLDHLQSRRK